MPWRGLFQVAVRTLGLAPSEFWAMTPPEFSALADMVPRGGGKFLSRDDLADLHETMKDHGMFKDGDGR
jgi:hypothetical protein